MQYAEFITVFEDYSTETLVRGGADFKVIASLIKQGYEKKGLKIRYMSIWKI